MAAWREMFKRSFSFINIAFRVPESSEILCKTANKHVRVSFDVRRDVDKSKTARLRSDRFPGVIEDDIKTCI